MFLTARDGITGKQKITDQIAQLKYKDPQSPKIVVLEQELVRAEAESLVAEAQLSNITREKIKAAFNYQFDALREHCEKVAMIAGYGKHLLGLIDDAPVTPGDVRVAYDGYEASKWFAPDLSTKVSEVELIIYGDSIIQDCEQALTNWVPARAAVKSTLSRRSRSHSAARLTRAREGITLAHQDRPLKSSSSAWVPASEHERKQRGQITDDDEYEDIEDEEEFYGQQHDGRRHHHHHAHTSGLSHAEDDTDVSPPESRGSEARQRSTKGANGVLLNSGERESAAEARGETPASLVAARAVPLAQQ